MQRVTGFQQKKPAKCFPLIVLSFEKGLKPKFKR